MKKITAGLMFSQKIFDNPAILDHWYIPKYNIVFCSIAKKLRRQ